MSSVHENFGLKAHFLHSPLEFLKFWCWHCEVLWNSSPFQPSFGGVEVDGPQDKLVSFLQVDT